MANENTQDKPSEVDTSGWVVELKKSECDCADRADAEKYQALMKSLGTMPTVHPPVWDSRNISQ